MARLPRDFYERPVLEVARDLLGKHVLKDGVGGPIVEAEAYDEDDAASHCHRGRTARNASMFLAGGHAYVYRIHQSVCMNVVADVAGRGCGVLIRAVVPERGRARIAARRRGQPERSWSDGPGKVCRALGIELADDGRDLLAPGRGGLRVEDRGVVAPADAVVAGPRVGISRAVELPWRFRIDADALRTSRSPRGSHSRSGRSPRRRRG